MRDNRVLAILVWAMFVFSVPAFATVLRDHNPDRHAVMTDGGICAWGCAQGYGCGTSAWADCVVTCCDWESSCLEQANDWQRAMCP